MKHAPRSFVGCNMAIFSRDTRGTNQTVIQEWSEGRSARNHKGTLTTNGIYLYSYTVVIGIRLESGVTIVKDCTAPAGMFHSMTTSQHVGAAKRVANTVMHPRVWEATPELHEFSDVPL